MSAPDVELNQDLLIPVGDATVAASRYEPTAHEGPLPAVLVATPYRKDDRITFGGWDPSVRYLCRRGYEVVVADLPGTGASTGEWRPYHRGEGEAVAAAIEWLADREWTTGDVGTFGLSYGAWTQYAAAAVDPEPLKAIVPLAVSNDAYASSCPGGVFDPLKRATWTVLVQTLRALPPSRRDASGRWARVWHDRLDDLAGAEPWLFRFLAHERRDDFWADRVVEPDEVGVPTLAACGYRDAHTAPMVEFVDGIGAPTRLVLGPWRHTMPERGRETAVEFRRLAADWFDRFLKGVDNGVDDGPPVAYWTEREGGWTPGAGTWRGADRWPAVDRAATLAYAVTPDGLRPERAFSAGTVDRRWALDHAVGVESLDRIGSVENAGVPTNGDDARSVTVDTEPLEAPVEWTGTGTATVRIRPTSADAVVAVRVGDVYPAGAARPVASGHVRATRRDGHEDPTPLEPGEVTAVGVPLKPKSHVFETGHRIRVALSGAFFPRALPLREQGPFDVVSTPAGPTRVAFPGRVHDGAVRFDDEVAMEPLDPDAPTAPPRATTDASSWAVDRDHTAGVTTLSTEDASSVDLPHGASMRTETAVDAHAGSSAGSAALSATVEAALEYDTEDVVATSEATVSRDAALLSTVVTLDGSTVFERTWRRPDPTG